MRKKAKCECLVIAVILFAVVYFIFPYDMPSGEPDYHTSAAPPVISSDMPSGEPVYHTSAAPPVISSDMPSGEPVYHTSAAPPVISSDMPSGEPVYDPLASLFPCHPIELFEGRVNYLRSWLPNLTTHSALELGPWFGPLLHKTNRTKNIKFFDALTREELQEKASQLNFKVDLNSVPFIDFVSKDGDLSIVNETFDVVYSSHNVEHQVNLLQHLILVGEIMNADGKFILAIPDHRYTFDHFKVHSTVEQVLQDYWNNQTLYPLRSFLQICVNAHNNPKDHWDGNHGTLSLSEITKCYAKMLQKYKETTRLSDILPHNSIFTPFNFRQIVETTFKMGLQPFQV
jgi:predicted SAM-dependent methyltransferase